METNKFTTRNEAFKISTLQVEDELERYVYRLKHLKNNKQNNKLNSPVLFTLGAGPNLMWGLSTPLNTRTCVVAARTAPSGRDRYQKDSELHLRRILCSSTISINQHIQQSINLSIYQSSISNISIN